MNVIMSIRPKYVESILNGEKRYEFRRSIFKDPGVDRVYIYSTSPVMKIVGYFVPGEIIEQNPEALWYVCHSDAGIDEEEFFTYFSNKDIGYALRIGDVHTFDVPMDPQGLIPGFKAPQNFMYAPEGFLELHS
jgi:type I restriction enzyme S subunit